MSLIEWVLALLYVLSAGFLFSERFRKNTLLKFLVAIILIGSTIATVFWYKDLVRVTVNEVLADRSEVATLAQSSPQQQAQDTSSTTDEAPPDGTIASPKMGNGNTPATASQPQSSDPSASLSSLPSANAATPTTSESQPEENASSDGDAGAASRKRPIFDVLSFEEIDNPGKTEVPFPWEYFRSSLQRELGNSSTAISEIRVGVAFIEPPERRHEATGGGIYGYILVSLPSLSDCSRKFGAESYRFQTATVGIMKAVNNYISQIADWIRIASKGETLTCPNA